MDIFFEVVRVIPSKSELSAYLQVDGWDDYGYETLFRVVFFDEEGVDHEIGKVKIGMAGQKEGEDTRDIIPQKFKALPEECFSLGQDSDYYSALNKLGDGIKRKLLKSLRDVVFSKKAFFIAEKEDVFKSSLTRFSSKKSIYGNYKKIVENSAPLTAFEFSYSLIDEFDEEILLDFKVDPEDFVPSNIHVLIGSNGVGKTYLLNSMCKSFIGEKESWSGKFIGLAEGRSENAFAGMVSLSFSSFDPFSPEKELYAEIEDSNYSYVGLKREDGVGFKSREELEDEFKQAFEGCIALGKGKRLAKSLEFLCSDAAFNDAFSEIVDRTPYDDRKAVTAKATEAFKTLSSGHTAVLLMLVNLVEKIEEKTLVLLDEPEVHLHPPLLASFLRALSYILSQKNAVAIIATHSPVVLQEVARDCVWKISRTGSFVKSERPHIETFGENVGVLTREVFSLELEKSGFYSFIDDKLSVDHDRLLENKRKLESEASALLYAKMVKK